MSMKTCGFLVAAVVALPGFAWAADVAEYRHYICEPVDRDLASYRIECPVVEGILIEEACQCDQQFVMVSPDTKIVTVKPKSASPE